MVVVVVVRWEREVCQDDGHFGLCYQLGDLVPGVRGAVRVVSDPVAEAGELPCLLSYTCVTWGRAVWEEAGDVPVGYRCFQGHG